MAEQYSLEAQLRTVIGKQVKALRRENLVPAVIYGAGGEPVHITCAYRPLEIVLQKSGATHLINVTVDGGKHTALVREVQRDKIKRTIQHVDFLRVDLSKKLRADVPIVLVGEPKLSSDLQLTHNIQSIEVECLPTDIPDHIEVNVSQLLTLGAQITVNDLAGYKGVEFLSDPQEVIARVDSLETSGTEEDMAAEPSAVTLEPEVIEKGKKEEADF
ncbi:MAG: 50S ribosomal protein L25 [Chloroflexota bacterium]